MITVLIPAHNEEQTIQAALDSVDAQGVPFRGIVVADNCTDATADVARAAGWEVFETVDNEHKKAGGLNQAWESLDLPDEDVLFVMDADSAIDPLFFRTSLEQFAKNPDLAGCGGTFRGSDGGGFVGWCQRNEYARYGRDVRRLGGKALVLTGTATAFRVSVLREVIRARSEDRLPGAAKLYDTKVLTEDNELTLAILTLGYDILCPPDCTLVTEVMENWRDLAKQRSRWKRGALENLLDYGFTKVTMEYWGRQALSLFGIIVTALYLLSISFSVMVGEVHFYWVFMLMTGVFMLERFITVKDRGLKHQLAGSILVLEMAYDVFLQGVQAIAFVQSAARTERGW